MRQHRHLAILLKKEMVQLLKDKKMKIIIFAPVFIIMLVFGHAATMDLKDCPFAVLDRARTAETRELTAKLEHSAVFVRKADFVDEKDMLRRVSKKDVKLGVVFPPDFTHSRQVEVVVDGRNTLSAGMAIGYASKLLASRDTDLGLLKVRIRGWYNPDYNARWFVVPCLLANLLLITLTILVAMSLPREWEAGTIDQLRLMPYTPFEMLLMKCVCGMLVGIVQTMLALVIIFAMYRIPFTGSVFGFALLILSFLIFAVGIGLLISVHCRNLQQAMVVTLVVTLPMMILSGLATPVAFMPVGFQYLSLVNPMAYAVNALQQFFLGGGALAVVLKPFSFIAGSGVICFFIAWDRFRRL